MHAARLQAAQRASGEVSSSRPSRLGRQPLGRPPPSPVRRGVLSLAARDDRQEVDWDKVEKENAGAALTSLAVEAESVRVSDSYADTVGGDSVGELVMKDLSYTYKRVQDDTQRAKRGLLFSKELLVRWWPGEIASRTTALRVRLQSPFLSTFSVDRALPGNPSPQVWALGLGQQPQLLEKLEKTRAELQEADQQVNLCALMRMDPDADVGPPSQHQTIHF